MTQTQIFRVEKFLRMLVNIDKIFFQGNKKNDSFIETYETKQVDRIFLSKLQPMKQSTKKRFLLFVLKISYSKKKYGL